MRYRSTKIGAHTPAAHASLKALRLQLALGLLVCGQAVALPAAMTKDAHATGNKSSPQTHPDEKQTPPAESASAARWQTLFDGRSLDGWRVVTRRWPFSEQAKVYVKDARIVLEEGSPGTAISYRKAFPKLGYELSLEAMRISGGDFFCGLSFPVGDSPCTLIVGGWGGGVVGLSNVDDLSADENETTEYLDFEQGKWYRVRLRVTDGKIEAWIGDKQIVDLATTGRRFTIWYEQEPVLPLGIATWRTTAALRNIRMRRTGDAKSP